MNEDIKTCLDEARLDEEEFEFEFSEVEDDKKSKKALSELENVTVEEPKKEIKKQEEIISKQITEEDIKTHENKILITLCPPIKQLLIPT